MKIEGVAVLAVAVAASSRATAFTFQSSGGGASLSQQRRSSAAATAAVKTVANTALYAQIPTLENWRILRSGEAYGTVTNHPTLPDGEVITTSRLDTKGDVADGTIVTTMTGSKYRLGTSKASGAVSAAKKKNAAVMNGMKAPAKAKPAPAKKKKEVVPAPRKPVVVKKKAPSAPKKLAAPKAAAAAEQSGPSLKDRLRQAKIDYGLTGKTVDDGRYLLSGQPQRSTSGKSQIYTAYRSDADGLPTGNVVTIKISPNLDAIERENRNYDSVTSGLFSGRFVKKMEFLRDAGSGFNNQCALVLETGKKNLKTFMAGRGFGRSGLGGRAMRNAAAAAAQCIQAMHTSRLVWTDLKAENFVVLPDSVDLAGMVGIDLESAISVGDNPVDYSPEACPPEFAVAFLQGKGTDFVLDYSYDVWSYGMLLYELSAGRAYFAGKSDSAITKVLRIDTFEPDLSAIKDAKLRDLIGQCLQRDPKKRPNIAQILLHPYFLTSGIGPFSF